MARQLTWDLSHEPLEQHHIDALVAEIQQVYLRDHRPWVIGFSGGKDSTAVVQLVIRALMALAPEQRTKPVYVISSDTQVENPRVKAWLDKCLDELLTVAAEYDLPVHVAKVTPASDQTFWVCLLGKGYPAPTSDFRWCTGRLKIEPAEAWVLENVDPDGRILQLLGSRKAESKARADSIERHALEGKFGACGSLSEGIAYMPIQDWDNDACWEYLRLWETPWKRPNDTVYIPDPMTGTPVPHYNNELFELYQDGHGGECVMDFDKRTASCGGSRFGCWTCTVVEQDKSMSNMVQMAHPEFAPLLAVRQKILDYRNDMSKRDLIGRNGRLRFATKPPVDDPERHGPWVTPGPYLLEVRMELVRDLFEIEKALPGFQTLTDTDLAWIRHWWETEHGAGARLDELIRVAYGQERLDAVLRIKAIKQPRAKGRKNAEVVTS